MVIHNYEEHLFPHWNAIVIGTNFFVRLIFLMSYAYSFLSRIYSFLIIG